MEKTVERRRWEGGEGGRQRAAGGAGGMEGMGERKGEKRRAWGRDKEK